MSPVSVVALVILVAMATTPAPTLAAQSNCKSYENFDENGIKMKGCWGKIKRKWGGGFHIQAGKCLSHYKQVIHDICVIEATNGTLEQKHEPTYS